MIAAWANSPWAQQVREYVERVTNAASAARAAYAGRDNDNNNDRDYQDEEAFQPPVDIYNTETSWVIHVAVPGAKKEDTDVSWDADKSAVLVSGLIYRSGNDEFLAGLITGERKVGLFNRTVTIPPEGGDGKEEADGTAVTAKMEDGLLIITVPKVEKEEQWTEIRKVDIE
jgi:HSP20 family protein